MGSVIDGIVGMNTVLAAVIIAGLVLAEDALFIGFVIPGETAAIIGGVIASRGHVGLPVMIAVVVFAAVLGDTIGYEVGRLLGARALAHRSLRRHRPKLDRAQDLLRRRGGGAVFLGRFTAFFRAVMPALAGTARMPYRRFLLFNAAGGIIWGTAAVTLGFLAGNSYRAVAHTAGTATAVVVALVVVVAVIIWRVRVRHVQRARH
ncbi:hypothetical protein BKD30_03075 [Tersicoccus phoenicis]|uniref:VTT domain-containing protein n=1 Tax=Tersicoccus phoenicis TaxID=554083 RepID=A0A1R1LJE0_9MICC|nr:DedA family protein [Tersicoccus phoenicis]OMH27644.1 hypothetical protein BKD30_03075 [Tersicoccus phoenicis]